MRLEQHLYREGVWSKTYSADGINGINANLVLAFGAKNMLKKNSVFDKLKGDYPNADIVYCSTSGEISGGSVYNQSVVTTAIEFANTQLNSIVLNISDFENAKKLGCEITKLLSADDLSHILILSDGQIVNGSMLLDGINAKIEKKVVVTGGLAGDGANFEDTLVGLDNNHAAGNVVAIGFYGNKLKVRSGSSGGWDEFGPRRVVTKSDGNILYELDGKSALKLYKKYLGEMADNLPQSALLFPLSLKISTGIEAVVRTILSIDEENSTMIFAGDIPEGSTVRLMMASSDSLIDGATQAAISSSEIGAQNSPELTIMVSCIGRKIVLNQRVEEEIEAIQDVFGKETCYSGFYSYGEIAPSKIGGKSNLHNQTMTLTTYSED